MRLVYPHQALIVVPALLSVAQLATAQDRTRSAVLEEIIVTAQKLCGGAAVQRPDHRRRCGTGSVQSGNSALGRKRAFAQMRRDPDGSWQEQDDRWQQSQLHCAIARDCYRNAAAAR